MIVHIVMWKLKDSANGNPKETNARAMKEQLESLNGNIPGLILLKVGINVSKTESSSDIVLYSEFKTMRDLEAYQEHPLHKAVMPFVAEVRSERRVVDFED